MRGLLLADTSVSSWGADSKPLILLYDKPMIYYSLSVLLLADIKDILIISTPRDTPLFQQLLGDGSQWGINLSYAVQPTWQGLAQALIIGSEFIGNQSSALVLGDNVFYGEHFTDVLQNVTSLKKGAHIMAYPVSDHEQYGVVLDENDSICKLAEKPNDSKSNYAVTGLYFYDSTAPQRARSLEFSGRGELEITDLNNTYLNDGQLHVDRLTRETIWFDAGTSGSLLNATRFVETVETRQGIKVCCPEEICWRKGYIDDCQLESLANQIKMNDYGTYLQGLIA